ncbi:unnamed protein product [Cylicocyclus nassatus]|uniref:Uncharacterized protein n=1 Tax=Cylicocyclus nassatus TaxID=53992 RepID=A0AA36GWN1_CYLNA|nr:unnamed protein product [Cylicocyclus nassatus]
MPSASLDTKFLQRCCGSHEGDSVKLLMMLSLETYFILSILLVDVSAQVFKCFFNCNAKENDFISKADCVKKCPKKEFEECRKRCMAMDWPRSKLCLAVFPLSCLF